MPPFQFFPVTPGPFITTISVFGTGFHAGAREASPPGGGGANLAPEGSETFSQG